MGQTPFFRTSHVFKHHFLNIEQTRIRSSENVQTSNLHRTEFEPFTFRKYTLSKVFVIFFNFQMRSIKSDLNKCLSSNIELRTYFFVKLISTLIFTKHYTIYTLFILDEPIFLLYSYCSCRNCRSFFKYWTQDDRWEKLECKGKHTTKCDLKR